jgi:hypothetical protein
MRLEFIDKATLIDKLRENQGASHRLIVLDGVLGAGQEAIADALGDELGTQIRHIDPGESPAAVAEDVRRMRETGDVAISGVMMLHTLRESGLEADVHVYLAPARANPRRQYWEGILSKPLNAYLAELDDDLDRRTVQYHWQTHPVINADYLVEAE